MNDRVKWLAYKVLSLLGWEFSGEVPEVPRLVIAGAPHTTNWDFVLFMAALHYYDIKVKYIGKHTLFRWPFGYFFRWLGGIPVNRSAPQGLIRQVVEALEGEETAILVMAPEGTRSPAPYWKRGFFHIAEGLQAPIVLAGVDYSSKRVHIGEPIRSDQGSRSVMDEARLFFEDFGGKDPAKKGPVRLEKET